MHPNNCFITLTYSDEKLLSPKLNYEDFQKFMKRLRKLQNDPMGLFVTGEYGDKTKRPHWHAIIFNWAPRDGEYKYSNDRGDRVYSSQLLTDTWGHGIAEYGSVTFHSAGYCARYAAKKLVHGKDQDHDFHPISKKSQKNAIGKAWLEKYWPDVFNHGQIVLEDGSEISIPRYYEKWLKANQPEAWLRYIQTTKLRAAERALSKANREATEHAEQVHRRRIRGSLAHPPTRREARKIIQKAKFETLQKKLKL